MIAIGVVAVAGAGSVSGAAAKQPSRLKVAVAPAAPTLRTPIAVTVTVPKLQRGIRYGAELRLPSGGDLACTDFPASITLRRTKSLKWTGTIKPDTASGAGVWCPGKGQIRIYRFGPGKLVSGPLLRRSFQVTLGRGESPPAEAFVPVKVSVLGGSTLTATGAGRPDRVVQLSGVLRGRIPGRFKPNTDITVNDLAGTITPFSPSLAKAVLAPDPLCPDTAPPATFDAIPPSQMVLKASGDTTWNLTLNGAPSQLFGCGPAGPPAGTTTLALAGRVGPKGLLELQQTASVTGIALPGGSQGGLAASLALNVDLSGRG